MFIDTHERPAGEVQQKVGRIKLSEAIRIGARIRPQGYGPPSTRGEDTSCVLQAAVEGMTGRLLMSTDACADFLGLPGRLITTLWRKNDTERLSRESIATWLEQQGF
jgi:hypothetical protein